MQAPNNITEALESGREKLISGDEFTYDESKVLCLLQAARYLETGTLPRNGYVCPAPGYMLMGEAAAAEEKEAIMAMQADSRLKAHRRHARRPRRKFAKGQE